MSTFDIYLEIDGVSLSIPDCWEVTNLQELISGPDIAGKNRKMPFRSGVIPKRRRATETKRTVNLNIDGNADHTGEPHGDPAVGVVLNIMDLRSLVTDPISYIDEFDPHHDSTRTATIHVKDTLTLTAQVQLGPLEVGAYISPSNVNAAFDLILVDGAFTEVES